MIFYYGSLLTGLHLIKLMKLKTFIWAKLISILKLHADTEGGCKKNKKPKNKRTKKKRRQRILCKWSVTCSKEVHRKPFPGVSFYCCSWETEKPRDPFFIWSGYLNSSVYHKDERGHSAHLTEIDKVFCCHLNHIMLFWRTSCALTYQPWIYSWCYGAIYKCLFVRSLCNEVVFTFTCYMLTCSWLEITISQIRPFKLKSWM